jgi:hypothetical protein
MFLLLRKRHTLHEHRLGGIYTIDEIVSHVMFMPINNEGHFGSVSITVDIAATMLQPSCR